MRRWTLLAAFGCLGCLAVAALLAVLGFFFLRRALDPEKVRPLAEVRLSAALGKPVRIGGMGLSFFPSPAVRATDITVGSGASEAPSLALASVRIAPDLAGLFTGKVTTVRVELEGVDCALRRDRKGVWLLPYAPPPEPAQSEGSVARPAVEIGSLSIKRGRFRLVDDLPPGGGKPREVVSLEGISGRLSTSGGTVHVQELEGKFQKTAVTGSAEITDDATVLRFSSPSLDTADLPQVMALMGAAPIEGLSVSGKAPLEVELTIPADTRPVSASGKFSAAELRLGTMAVQRFEAPFVLEKGVVTLKPLTFTAYKGKETGTVTLFVTRTPLGYAVKTDLEGLDVNAALSANTSAKDLLLGTGKVSGTVRGAGFDAGALKSRLGGEADVAVEDGVVKGVPLLAKINQALHITGGDSKDTKFESLTGHFVLGGGKAHTEDLVLKAGELSVLAKGDVNFDLTLDFKGRAVFTPAKTAAIVHSLSDLKRFVNDRGELELPLTVKGPVSSPSISVDLAAAVKEGLKGELKDQLRKLLGR